MRERTIWAVLPIKRTDRAKQRLSPVLTRKQRQSLALLMMQDVLDALIAARGLEGIMVVTEDPSATAIAGRAGCRVVADGADSGHTAAVTTAGTILRTENKSGLLTIPGDVPLVTAAEIEALLAAHATPPAFTIAPAHDDLGSNAILLTPPDAVKLRFGKDSFRWHLAAARAAGLVPRVLRLRGLGCDLDAPTDLERFMTMDGITRTRLYLQETLGAA